jgi:hypothetical protein
MAQTITADQIRARLAAGDTWAEAGAFFGISRSSIRDRASVLGVKALRRSGVAKHHVCNFTDEGRRLAASKLKGRRREW